MIRSKPSTPQSSPHTPTLRQRARGALGGVASLLLAVTTLLAIAGPAYASAALKDGGEDDGIGGLWRAQGPAPVQDDLRNVGPDNSVDGAVHAVVPHPTDPNTVYIGAVNGGVWVTHNATATKPTWTKLTDSEKSQAIGALEFDPTDESRRTLVAGPGAYSAYGDGGDLSGILRTTNGGESWKLLTGDGVLLDKSISGIAARGKTIVASVDFAPVLDFPFIGIFRSTDTGKHFSQISQGSGAATGLPGGLCHDLAGDPLRPSRLYTSVVFADFVGGHNGIYRSDDTGATWTKVSTPAIEAIMISGRTNNVEFAVGRHNNVYVAIVNNFVLAAVFRSGDGGSTWTQMDLPTTIENGFPIGIHPGGQGDFHLSLVADPTDANLVYIGGDRQPALNEADDFATTAIFPNSIGATGFWGRLFRGDASRPSGSQWVHLTARNDRGPAGGGTASNSGPHVDSREMAFDAAGNLLEGDDGGIYKRTLPRSNQGDWFSLLGNLQITEVHDIALDRNTNTFFGGVQDNDVILQNTPNSLDYSFLIYGDGGDANVDDLSTPGESIRYTSRNFLRTFNRSFWSSANDFLGVEFPALFVLDGGPRLVRQFYTPVRMSGGNPLQLVIGGANGVYESVDQGDTIRSVGPGIRVNSIGYEPLAYGVPANPNALYVGGSDVPSSPIGSKVWVRTAPYPAPLTRSLSYPGTSPIRAIAIDPRNGSHAFVADSSAIYQTNDAGVTWTNVTGNLGHFEPSTLRSIAFANTLLGDAIAVGTNRGVYIANAHKGFAKWKRLGNSLPTAPVLDLRYDPLGDRLTAGTLGRGVFSLGNIGLAVAGDDDDEEND